MKKILSLLLLSSSIFAMEIEVMRTQPSFELDAPHAQCTQPLDIVQLQQNASVIKTLLKDTYITGPSVFVPARLGKLDLFHGKKGFSVLKDNQRIAIEKYNTDKLIRNMTREQLIAFLSVGYVSINQMSDGQYSLKADGRLNGGGPILGAIAYWVTKVVCYAVPVAALGTAVVVTGGAAGAVAGAGAAAAGTAITTTAAATTAGATIATTAGVVTATAATAASVGTGVGVAGAAIAGAGMAGQAAVVTAAAVSTTGTVAGTVVAIEALSTAVGTFFGMLPTP